MNVQKTTEAVVTHVSTLLEHTAVRALTQNSALVLIIAPVKVSAILLTKPVKLQNRIIGLLHKMRFSRPQITSVDCHVYYHYQDSLGKLM